MNAQEKWWSGEAGDAYTARNRVDWRKRIPFWQTIFEKTGMRSVMEVGCNAGWNLSAIEALGNIAVYGCEINPVAREQAQWCGFQVEEVAAKDLEIENTFDLVFTCGVLIHVPTRDLIESMDGIIRASADWVLAVEYASEQEEPVVYRGETDRLWRRNYGKLYQDMGLKLIETGDPGSAFDRCTYWLLRK